MIVDACQRWTERRAGRRPAGEPIRPREDGYEVAPVAAAVGRARRKAIHVTQESLDFGRGERIAAAHRRLLRALVDAVDAIGLIQAAGACDARKSELSDALNGRDGRYMRSEWVLAIADAAPPDFRARIVAALIEWLGMSAVPIRPRTPEERLAELERRVAAELGAAGQRVVEENRR